MTTAPSRRGISIHVPREGHDKLLPARADGSLNFNPRAPRGARRWSHIGSMQPVKFQSTCPARGTTGLRYLSVGGEIISIHVPREGHDYRATVTSCCMANFNPRAPRGARHSAASKISGSVLFQSTCPARGTTLRRRPGRCTTRYFNPRAPRGARRRSLRRAPRGR